MSPTYGLIGALAAFPRRLAAREVARAGGRLQRGSTRQTTHVVFGRALLARTDDTAIADRCATEHAAGRALLSENGFLRQLGLLEPAGAADLPRSALLDQSGLAGAELELLALFDAFEHDAEPFSFRDLILARKYAGLIAGGATPAAIARSVHRFGPAVSLTAKSLHVGDGRAIYAEDPGGLAELDGQLLLDLDAAAEDPDDLFAAAEDAEAAGLHEQAATLYGRCLAVDPSDAVAAFNRANCLAAAGRPADAERDYARALKADPDFVEAWFNLAGVARDRGATDAARAHLREAVGRDPDYADAVFNLAALEFEAGELAAAQALWARYLELDPDSEWARTARHGLHFVALQSAPGNAG